MLRKFGSENIRSGGYVWLVADSINKAQHEPVCSDFQVTKTTHTNKWHKSIWIYCFAGVVRFPNILYLACELRGQSFQSLLELHKFLSPSVGKEQEVRLHLWMEQAHCCLSRSKYKEWGLRGQKLESHETSRVIWLKNYIIIVCVFFFFYKFFLAAYCKKYSGVENGWSGIKYNIFLNETVKASGENNWKQQTNMRKHVNNSDKDFRWTYHLVVFCDVSNLIGNDKVYQTVSV